MRAEGYEGVALFMYCGSKMLTNTSRTCQQLVHVYDITDTLESGIWYPKCKRDALGKCWWCELTVQETQSLPCTDICTGLHVAFHPWRVTCSFRSLDATKTRVLALVL